MPAYSKTSKIRTSFQKYSIIRNKSVLHRIQRIGPIYTDLFYNFLLYHMFWVRNMRPKHMIDRKQLKIIIFWRLYIFMFFHSIIRNHWVFEITCNKRDLTVYKMS